MAANTKNTQEQGGNLWKVNGTLTVGKDGQLQLTDTSTSTIYKIVVTDGVLSVVEA